MRLFNDIFSGASVASDAFPHEIVYGGAAIKFTAKFETKKDDISGVPAGEGDNEMGEGETVINLVDTYRLHEVEGYKVKEWMAVVKDVMGRVIKRIKEKGELDDDQIKEYKKGCVEFVNYLKKEFDNIQIFQGEIGEYEGVAQSFGYAISNPDNYEEIFIYFFKGALEEEKY